MSVVLDELKGGYGQALELSLTNIVYEYATKGEKLKRIHLTTPELRTLSNWLLVSKKIHYPTSPTVTSFMGVELYESYNPLVRAWVF